jgi:hypothetical protein
MPLAISGQRRGRLWGGGNPPRVIHSSNCEHEEEEEEGEEGEGEEEEAW